MQASQILADVVRYSVIQSWSDYDLRLDADASPTVERYEWKAEQHPRWPPDSPQGIGGEFKPASGSASGAGAAVAASINRLNPSKRRELAALPDIQKGHHLHHSSLPSEVQSKMLDWNYRINEALNPMYVYAGQQSDPDRKAAAEESGWNRVDKAKVQSLLAEMNQMDREARKHGIALSDFVNANGIIPKELAERLTGGSRFFDPEKLRGKLKSKQQEVDPNQKTVNDYRHATRDERKAMLANPSISEAIQKALGLKPSSQPQESAPQPTQEPEAPSVPNKFMGDGLSTQASNKLDGIVGEVVGDGDESKKQFFRSAVIDAWKQMKMEAEEHNDALRQITSALGKNHGALAANISKGIDVTRLRGFDELVDYAARHYPQLVAKLRGESDSGSAEEGLVSALREGIRDVPQPWDEPVIDRAMGFMSPGFFEDVAPETAGVDDWDKMPFSVRSDIARRVQRYWINENIRHWVEMYSCNSVSLTCIDASIIKSSMNGSSSDSKLLSDSANTHTVPVHGFNNINVDANRVKVPLVATLSNDHQVFNSVIKPVPIDMMDMLTSQKGPSNVLLHDPSVFTHRFSVTSDIPVLEPVTFTADPCPTPVVFDTAVSGTKKPLLSSESGVAELYSRTASAVKAVGRDLRHVDISGKKVAIHVNPSERQKDAGCYRMGHVSIHGLDITIETPKGWSRREGWPKMAAHYGYIRSVHSSTGPRGSDGDHVDVFVGPDRSSELVYVIDQPSRGGGFDEHKAMIGFRSKEAAIAAYRDSYTVGWVVGKVTTMTIEQFKAWLRSGDTTKPIKAQVSKYSAFALA
jgi:hypothetical protein